MESSQFTDCQPSFESLEPLEVQGATCDTFRVKLYGKLHFLKRLKPEYSGDIRYQEAFRKEFETGYRLEHPNLVRYVSMDNNGMLMEYVDGETLTQRLARQPEYFEDKKHTDKFIRQLLDAVGYLHSHQVLHLDLKPDNMMLTRINDALKLVDLGCCYNDTFADTTGHTEHYAAPEQLSIIHCPLSIRTDIFAIGRILEQLPNHDIYNKVIARCTAEDPEKRYKSVEELSEALFAPSRFPHPSSRFYAFLLAISVIVIGILVALYLIKNKPVESVEYKAPMEEMDNPEKTKKNMSLEPDEEHVISPVPPDGKSTNHQDKLTETNRQETGLNEENSKAKQASQSVAGNPIRESLGEDDKDLLNNPELRVVTDEEFVRYKHQLDQYYAEVNAFLNDSASFKKYPSHVAYAKHYQDLVYNALQRINADKWFRPLYRSPMNPVSSYTRKYKREMEHKAFANQNKLP